MFIVAMDFDNTIFEGSTHEETGVLRKDVVAKIREVIDHPDCEIALWTCRSGEKLEKAKRMLDDLNLKFDSYNESTPSIQKEIDDGTWEEGRKIFAHLYVDDRSPNSIDVFLKMKVDETAKNFV